MQRLNYSKKDSNDRPYKKPTNYTLQDSYKFISLASPWDVQSQLETTIRDTRRKEKKNLNTHS